MFNFPIPWRLIACAIVVAGLAFAIWKLRHDAYADGVAAENSRWLAATSEQLSKQRDAERERDAAAARIADETRVEAATVNQATQRETNRVVVEVVRPVIQRVEVPANCPQGPPVEILDAGRAVVARVRKANAL